MGAETGLRERKKRETRRRIADAAMRLFVADGFDQTTVADVAAAADVSTKTVFNYFPAKEDLFFDRAAEVEQRWLDAVADRHPGEPVLAGLRRRALARFADHPSPHTDFLRVMADSNTLQAHGQRIWATHENAITEALAGLLNTPPDDPTPRVLANQTLNIHPLAIRMADQWTRQGLPLEQVRTHITQLINRAFDILDPSKPPPQPPN